MIANLYNDDSIATRMLSLIERCAPKLMRSGGGALSREQSQIEHRPRMSPDQRETALRLARTGRYTGTEIAGMVGTSQSAICKLLAKHGVEVRDGRK